jgi:hypothetical protein
MNAALISDPKSRIAQMEADNKRLFTLGISQLVVTFLLFFIVWINGAQIDNFMGDGGPWGRPALQRLDAIVAETAREAYILSVVRGIIPLGIVAVKNSFIYSTLMWLLVLSFLIIGFAMFQKKQLDAFKEIVKT